MDRGSTPLPAIDWPTIDEQMRQWIDEQYRAGALIIEPENTYEHVKALVDSQINQQRRS